MSIATTSNVPTLAECVLELVSNSLKANATAIAIRIHRGERKIQIIDNGIGIPRERLNIIGEYNSQNTCNCCNTQYMCNLVKKTLTDIRKLSDAMLITSRYYTSSETYMKVFKAWCNPTIVEIYRRPSHGTTVSIYGFHELSFSKWNIPSMYHLVANIAVANVHVSFSIRDDEEKKVIMIVGKPHNPIEIIRVFYGREILFNNLLHIKDKRKSNIEFSAYIALAKPNATQHIFLNNKPVHCPLLLQTISNIFIASSNFFIKVQSEQILKRKAVFILLFVTCREYTLSIENGKKTLFLPNIQDLLQNIRREMLNTFHRNIAPLSNISRYVRAHKDFMYSYKNNLDVVKIFKETPIFQRPYASQRHHILHTAFCRIIKRKTPQICEGTTDGQNLSKVGCLEENEIQSETTADQLIINETSDVIKTFTPASRNENIMKETFTAILSEWSNWSYSDKDVCNSKKTRTILEKNRFDSSPLKFYKHFDFLPEYLHKLLRGKVKLTKTDILNGIDGSTLSAKLKSGLQIPNILFHQEMAVRTCKAVQRFREFRLKKELLKFVRVLGQMNNELIVGLIIENNRRVLVLMDQHAIHERIRYEDLLDKYKSQRRDQLLFVKLKDPIVIDLPTDKCNLLVSRAAQLQKLGISLGSRKDNALAVYTVPECLKKQKYYYNQTKLKSNVQSLLNELLQSIIKNERFDINNLPFTIHNAIAMEACRGAIKFGDPLTLQQCEWLLKLLNGTKIPTRCAHGRPSIIPILVLSELENRARNVVKKKLNFAALRQYNKKINLKN